MTLLHEAGIRNFEMYLLFLDESGTPPAIEKAAGKFFVIGGVIINEKEFNSIFTLFEDIKKKYRVIGEIKSSFFGLLNTKKENSLLHLSHEEKKKLKLELIERLIVTQKISILAAIFDVNKAYSSHGIKSPNDIYHHTYMVILKRFRRYLRFMSQQEQLKCFGMIIADHRSSDADKTLRNLHHKFTDKLRLDDDTREDNILGSIHFMPSELSPFLQLADLVAGICFRAYQNEDRFLFNAIKPHFEAFQNPEFGIMVYNLSSGGEV